MKNLILLLAGVLTGALLFGCSSSSGGGDMAGATGVGNPTETVGALTQISVATTNEVTSDENNLFVQSETEDRSSRSLPQMVDVNSLQYSVNSVNVNVSKISWEIGEIDNSTELDPKLEIDDEELTLIGPFSFDGLSGESLSELQVEVKLPSAEYKKVRFYFDSSDAPAVTISGSVRKNEIQTPFLFEIPLTTDDESLELKFENKDKSKPVFLSDEVARHIELHLNIDSWMNYFDPFPINEDGHGDTLYLGASAFSKGSNLHTIRNNIKKSGTLKIIE
jgi:hypothetical protein